MNVLRRVILLALVLLLAGGAPTFTADSPLTEFWSSPLSSYPMSQLRHDVGSGSRYGWHADFRIHDAGYLVKGLPDGGERLPEGTYRYDFYFALRPGTLRTWLMSANDVARIEVKDSTTLEILLDRTFQRTDFPSTGRTLTRKTLTFSTWGRPGHRFEPRVYWPGLSGLFLARVDVNRLEDVSLAALTDKSVALETMMPTFLDRGYVVERSADGQPQDLGDSAIWTGLYVAAEAWHYQTTGNSLARARMETSLWALHRLHQHSPTAGTLLRYIDSDGVPLPDAPSKDTYTGFFFGVAQGLPWVKDPVLKRALLHDIRDIATHLLDHDLKLEPALGPSVDFNPYLAPGFLSAVRDDLRRHPREVRQVIKVLAILRWYFRLNGQRPSAILAQFEKEILHPQDIPSLSQRDVLNGLFQMLKQIEKNLHHSATEVGRRRWPQNPYAKLDLILQRALNTLEAEIGGETIQSVDQIKILPSESLHALHLIKIAAELLPKPNRFDAYYRENLWQGKALLATAEQWSNIDEEFLGAALGDTYADASRTGSSHLTFLALYDVLTFEKDPALRTHYESIFEREWSPMRSDYNAMLQVMEDRIGWRPHQMGLALWSLGRYPMDRRGLGDDYWKNHHDEWTNAFGGEVAGKARDPIPPNWRPRDAFLWQRSARSLRGDNANAFYPPVDYLFVYWMARAITTPRTTISDNPKN